MTTSRARLRTFVQGAVVAALFFGSALAQSAPPLSRGEQLKAQILDNMAAHERQLVRLTRGLTPRVETYLQNVRPDSDLGFVPTNDHYFLGRLRFDTSKLRESTFVPDPPEKWRRWVGPVTDKFTRVFIRLVAVDYLKDGFVQMIYPDPNHFDREHYNFNFIRREFLGEVRCYVFDVAPKSTRDHGAFIGRIWVEDQNDHLVRFNGTFWGTNSRHIFFHFDSWRVNSKPDLWVPAYIYTEETDMPYNVAGHLRIMGQTRLWGYDLKYAGHQDELTDITVEGQDMKDPDAVTHNLSPVESMRAWERQAENNILERLEKAGLMSSEGDVDQVLDTVLNNLLVTSNLNIDPPVRCRVLLTTPLESFTVGHTIVLSRGLLDTLPDEASLAVMIAHELGHIAAGQRLDTRYAFGDRMLFPDEDVFEAIRLARTSVEESQADAKAMDLLLHCPLYKDQLSKAGLYLRALVNRQSGAPNLVSPHLGSQMFVDGYLQRLNAILAAAPPLLPKRIDQMAALPLGARMHLDPWSARLTMEKNVNVALLSAREKVPFQVTPFIIYLTRSGQTPAAGSTPAATAQNSGADATKAPTVP